MVGSSSNATANSATTKNPANFIRPSRPVLSDRCPYWLVAGRGTGTDAQSNVCEALVQRRRNAGLVGALGAKVQRVSGGFDRGGNRRAAVRARVEILHAGKDSSWSSRKKDRFFSVGTVEASPPFGVGAGWARRDPFRGRRA